MNLPKTLFKRDSASKLQSNLIFNRTQKYLSFLMKQIRLASKKKKNWDIYGMMKKTKIHFKLNDH